MKVSEFLDLRQKVISAGYGDEIAWQESVTEPEVADEFLWQYIWVVISAGMKNQVARVIEQRIVEAYNNKRPISTAFRHRGKVKAIEYMIANHDDIFDKYLEADNRLDFLESLPFIGKITKYHLAKNLGEDVVKPDRHLIRIAQKEGVTPLVLCELLAKKTGYRIGTVDLILWRAANLGLISGVKQCCCQEEDEYACYYQRYVEAYHKKYPDRDEEPEIDDVLVGDTEYCWCNCHAENIKDPEQKKYALEHFFEGWLERNDILVKDIPDNDDEL